MLNDFISNFSSNYNSKDVATLYMVIYSETGCVFVQVKLLTLVFRLDFWYTDT